MPHLDLDLVATMSAPATDPKLAENSVDRVEAETSAAPEEPVFTQSDHKAIDVPASTNADNAAVDRQVPTSTDDVATEESSITSQGTTEEPVSTSKGNVVLDEPASATSDDIASAVEDHAAQTLMVTAESELSEHRGPVTVSALPSFEAEKKPSLVLSSSPSSEPPAAQFLAHTPEPVNDVTSSTAPVVTESTVVDVVTPPVTVSIQFELPPPLFDESDDDDSEDAPVALGNAIHRSPTPQFCETGVATSLPKEPVMALQAVQSVITQPLQDPVAVTQPIITQHPQESLKLTPLVSQTNSAAITPGMSPAPDHPDQALASSRPSAGDVASMDTSDAVSIDIPLGALVLAGEKPGYLRFVGRWDVMRMNVCWSHWCCRTSFAEGIWAGVELQKPTGKNDGSVNGVRYFTAPLNHGAFVRPSSVC